MSISKKLTQTSIQEFVTLVTDGKEISDMAHEVCSHNKEINERDRIRKNTFLDLGKKVFETLGTIIGESTKAKNLRAGPLLSGDIILLGPNWHLHATHYVERASYGDISFHYDGDLSVTEWYKWEELLDLEAFARKINNKLLEKRMGAKSYREALIRASNANIYQRKT